MSAECMFSKVAGLGDDLGLFLLRNYYKADASPVTTGRNCSKYHISSPNVRQEAFTCYLPFLQTPLDSLTVSNWKLTHGLNSLPQVTE